jgi:hypothetical protein
MILLNPVVEVGTLPDPDRLQLAPRSILEPVRRVTGRDGFAVGLATVDRDPLRSAMPLERLAQKPLGSGQIAPFAEPEFNRVAMVVDGSIEIHPSPSDFDVRFIDMPFPADGSLAPIELLKQERSIVDRPAMDGGMVNGDASLGHHLLKIPQAEAVSQIPSHTQQDHRAIEMTAFEHHAPPELAGGIG